MFITDNSKSEETYIFHDFCGILATADRRIMFCDNVFSFPANSLAIETRRGILKKQDYNPGLYCYNYKTKDGSKGKIIKIHIFHTRTTL